MSVFTCFSGVKIGVFQCLFSGVNSHFEILQENLGEMDDLGNSRGFSNVFHVKKPFF
jgi:hypothetical protein